MSIEQKRQILEELDRIELALSSRLLKSDEFLPPKLRRGIGKKYSARENSLRRREATKLVERYIILQKSWQSLENVAELSLDDEMVSVQQLDDDVPAPVLASKYAVHSQERGLQRFCCDFTVLAIDDLREYPAPELYGEILCLEPFCDPQRTYRNFLANFEQERATPQLLKYLKDFYNRKYYIGPGTGVEELANAGDEATNNSDDQHYCSACERTFTNPNVFRSHLSGKKHQRNAAQISSSVSMATLVRALQPELHNTLANVDRKSGMTLDERQLEIDSSFAQRQAEDERLSESEDEIEEEKKAKPLCGPEGRPIPRWLVKLHGLGTVFGCEICGLDVKYTGRKNYERHFTTGADSRHAQGLRLLGIEPSPAFHGVARVSEAQALQRKLSVGRKLEREVEDDEGNVMSARMYEDLKRQGDVGKEVCLHGPPNSPPQDTSAPHQ